MYSYEDIFKSKNKILFVVAHPDDIDVFYGGTLARLVKDGKEVFVLVMTNGAFGSKDREISVADLGALRMKEQAEALAVLGLVSDHLRFLNHRDGEVQDQMEIIAEVAGVIREFKPDIVCSHDPADFYLPSLEEGLSFINHRDHRYTGQAVLNAVYPFSRDRSFFPEQIQKGAELHTVYELVLSAGQPKNALFDITAVIEQKREALLCHQSQFDAKVVEEILGRRQIDGKYYEPGNYLKLAW